MRSSGKKRREINRMKFEDLKEAMRERVTSEKGKERYALRGRTVEPRIGTLKSVLDLRKFLGRGLDNVKIELNLASTALNVGILMRHWTKVKERKARSKPADVAAATRKKRTRT